MAVSGLWQQRAAMDYTGATRWGTGVNPIHGVADNGRGRVVGVRANLYPLGDPSGSIPDSIAPREIDFIVEDYVSERIPGEMYRYQDEYPTWDQRTPEFRDSTNNPAMGETGPWGVYWDDDTTGMFPQPGPTGGTANWLDVSHGDDVEQQHAIAVPTPFVSGGWLGKVRGANALSEAQAVPGDGYVFGITASDIQGQGVQSLDNVRAVERGTDAPRSAIQSRTAGARIIKYGRSFMMGGGSGTPDMFPFQQTAGLKRPWLTRRGAVPPIEEHMFNTFEQRTPFARTMSPDPYQGDPEVGAGDVLDATGWGY